MKAIPGMPGAFANHDPAPPCCWQCGATLDGATNTDFREGPPPRAGDITITACCGALSIFEEDGVAFREPTDAEVAKMKAGAEWAKIVFIQAFFRAKVDRRRPGL